MDGAGRGRRGDLEGPAAAAVYRSCGLEAGLRGEPAVAEEANGCLGRRRELLPGAASRGEAEGDHALRAVDGAFVHRGQHRWGYRARGSEEAGGILFGEAERRRSAVDGGAECTQLCGGDLTAE